MVFLICQNFKIAFSNLHDLLEVTNERRKKILCLIQFYKGMFVLKVTWADGLLGMTLVVRCPWFWDLWNLLFKLMFGLTEVPEAWGGALLDPSGGGVPMSVEEWGCPLGLSTKTRWWHPRRHGPEPQLWQCSCLLPNLCPHSPAAHFCGWYIPIPHLRIREPLPLHTAMWETELHIILTFYSHPITAGYISHICITWPGCFSGACLSWPPGPHSRCQRCSHQDT